MNIIYPNLNRQLYQAGVSLEKLSCETGIEFSILKQKMQGLLPFSLVEAIKIAVYLHNPDLGYLFFQLDINT